MRLDEHILIITSIACCVLSLFERGLMLQTAAFITVTVAACRFDPHKMALLHQNQKPGGFFSSSSVVPPFFPAAGARILVPLLLVAERIYHMRYSIGHNPAPMWACLVWVWCSVTYEATVPIRKNNDSIEEVLLLADEDQQQVQKKQKQQSARTMTTTLWLGIVPVDEERLGISLLYAVTTSAVFLLLTLNLHVGAAFFAFVVAALLTESLLRLLFRDWRCDTVSASSSAVKKADAEETLRVLDSEIFVVSTLAGWLVCDIVADPFTVSPKSFQMESAGASSAIRAEALRRNTASALPEHIAGRSLLFGAWLSIVLYALVSLYLRQRATKNNNNNNKAKVGVGVSRRKAAAGAAAAAPDEDRQSQHLLHHQRLSFFNWICIVAFTAVVSLLLVGWQCAYCFNEEIAVAATVAEEQEFLSVTGDDTQQPPPSSDAAADGFFVQSVPIQKRFQRLARKFRSTLRRAAHFQNPLLVWKNLLLPSDANNPSQQQQEQTQSSFSAPSAFNVVRLRMIWIGVFLVAIPLLSSLPFVISKLAPRWHRTSVPRIVWRKWFHFVAVAVFTFPTFVDPRFMSMAWMGALALAALVELARFRCVPPFASLTPLLESVTDDRDALVIRTHWYLMLGCAIPVIVTQRTAFFWSHAGESDVHWLAVAALRIVPGLGCLGVGDALSAIIGTVMGRSATAKWAVLFNPAGFYSSAQESSSPSEAASRSVASPSSSMPASALVRNNPVLEKKSIVGTLLGGFVITFFVVVGMFVASRLAADRFVLSAPPAPVSVGATFFLVKRSVWETAKLFAKLAAVLGYGALYETVAGGVDNLELPLAAMVLSFVIW